MKRDGFWRYATPAVGFFGIPLPFLMIYLVWFRWPSMLTLYICSGILLFFIALNFFGWNVRTILTRIISRFRGKVASGRPWWYRHFTETTRRWTGL
ncbi:conjugal transfer protein [Kluyvera cryocrescens]|uniref:Conjugal transfer protein n=1 Tax=Kluyvera cryocrescens TaxID=580 RepID=A0AAW9CDF2_KLUCR|nr:conjugal transfer protein [Kluyvera cryocrescens]MDW3779669.1 conjugal transfer protein [Kluyvera cryocrescens]MEB7558762.1 conjugal transfer protein [Kluyvera cryocrescens]